MLQAIFVVPIIYFVIRKYDFFGTILCLFFTAFWEAFQFSCGVSGALYRIIIFRYISIIAFGVFIAIGKTKLNIITLVSMFVIGIGWQTALCYIPLHPVFMNYDWARVNYISSIFIMPIMYVLIKNLCESDIRIVVLQELGKASFNIFLAQMAFYGCGGASVVYKFVAGTELQLFVCIVICSLSGYAYYRVENKVTKRIINHVKSKNFYKKTIHSIAD